MAEQVFDPVRVLAELNALGVRFVLVGDLASDEPDPVRTADRIEICVADDDDDIDGLRTVLVAHEAEQDGFSDDPHRAVFRTNVGRVECLEMPADAEFAELERRAEHVDFGNGVIVRAAPQLHARGTPQWTPAPPMVNVSEIADVTFEETSRLWDRFRRRRREEDYYYEPDGQQPGRAGAVWQRMMEKFEDIDDFLSGTKHRNTDR